MSGLMNPITNPKSERVKHLADLLTKRGRDKTQKFLIEGPQSVREAVHYRPEIITDLYVQVADV
ncbi:MAG: hypothetical protein Q3961_04135, partial [Bifidobacteriaceae bacterium]|nr:hypothetical protein [Bifidobacteriaceae bacterium]